MLVMTAFAMAVIVIVIVIVSADVYQTARRKQWWQIAVMNDDKGGALAGEE